jgi:hypothetical protein
VIVILRSLGRIESVTTNIRIGGVNVKNSLPWGAKKESKKVGQPEPAVSGDSLENTRNKSLRRCHAG